MLRKWLVIGLLSSAAWSQEAYRDITIVTDPPGAEVWIGLDPPKNTLQKTDKPVRVERDWFFDPLQNPVGRTLIFRLPGHEEAKIKVNWGQLGDHLQQDGKPFRLAPTNLYFWVLDHPLFCGGLALGLAAAVVALLTVQKRSAAARQAAEAQREAAKKAEFQAMQEQARQQADRERAQKAEREAQEEARKAREQQELLAAKQQSIQDTAGKDPWIGIEFSSGRIGTYRAVSLLGAGGMGAVYEGVLVSGKPVSPAKLALKIVDLRVKPDAKERAISEGQVGMQIVHSSIVRCYDYVELPQAICMFQELVEGKSSLKDKVVAGGLDPLVALDLMLPVAAALLVMHEKGYIHRDIKPENIMLSADGQLKIADLGLAKNPHAGFQTDSRDFMGTFAYCAPEQITNTSKVTPAADQYALGCVLYELIEGSLPFKGPDYLQFAAAHLQETPPPAGKLSASANAALLRMLEKDPLTRYENTVQALESIKQAL